MGKMLHLSKSQAGQVKRTTRRKRNYRKQGKQLEQETIKSLQKLGIWVHRLYDTQDWQAKCVKCGYEDKKIIAQKQPGDIEFLFDQSFYVMECKSSYNKLYFPMRNIAKDHQFTMGMDIIANGGFHCFFVSFRERNKSPKGWLIPTPRFYLVREELRQKGETRFGWHLIKKIGYPVERKKSNWEFNTPLTQVKKDTLATCFM